MGNRKRLISAAVAAFCFALSAFAQPSLTFRAGESVVSVDQRGDGNQIMAGAFPVCTTLDAKIGWYDTSGSVFSYLYKQPQYGIGTSVELLDLCRYTENGYMSNIYNVYGFVDRPMIRTDLLTFQYTLELGAGFTSGVWDPVTNAGNQVVGSIMTAHLGLGLEVLFNLPHNQELGIGLYYIHNSNGSTRMPNRGYNGIELAANYKYNFREKPAPITVEALKDTTKARAAMSPRLTYGKGFNVDVYASGSVSCLASEHYFKNCKNCSVYPRFAFGADVMYRYARRFGSGLGVDVFYTPKSVSDKLEQLNDELYSGSEHNYQPVSAGLCAIQEFYYRNLTFRMGMGIYLYNRDGFNYNRITYQTMALRYYIPKAGNIFVGLGLKAHRFTMADCIQMTVGKRF